MLRESTDYGAVKPYYSFAGSPVVAGDLLILTANTSGMAVNCSTGELVWGSEKPPREAAFKDTNGTEYSTPVVYTQNGRRYALLYSWKGLSAVDVETGRPLWVYKWDFYFVQVADPVLIEDRILLVSELEPSYERTGVLLKIAAEGPSVRWKSPALISDITTPVLIDS